MGEEGIIKLEWYCRIYDMDNDGYVSNGELFQVLKMMVGNNLKDTQLQQIVDKTIILYDKVRVILHFIQQKSISSDAMNKRIRKHGRNIGKSLFQTRLL